MAGDGSVPSRAAPERALLEMLDTPILFVKRFNYLGIHIYDTYYKWRPGGGIYVLENPQAPAGEQRVRPVIDPGTPETLGTGMYSEPELSWDGTRFLFCFKPTASGSTSIYEIGIDGTGLRRLTDPTSYCESYCGAHGGQHDVSPAYLPDGRIVFTSTRFSGLVPCANSGVDILHVMNVDGSDIHPISVNNVNEFDPAVLPDGRILHGRWEYVDKTALTQQSLWSISPDGTNETALFANNMVHPEAVLDARPVPGTEHLVVGSLTRHNAPPRGSIAFIDPSMGKNSQGAMVNLEHPENPTFDQGDSCEPWPLSKDVVLYSGKPPGHEYNGILLIDRRGNRVVVYADPKIDCHSPMPVKSRIRPPVLAPETKRDKKTGRFIVQDIYQGLTGVERGEVKWLRVIEETSRVSATPGGAYNQTFLVSAVLAFTVKNYLGVVPVEPDGSAYFEVPAGRAIYLQALDGEGRLVQSMRTFVQAAPGVTRSCIGCHEHKSGAPQNRGRREALRRAPARLQPESWGTGFVDYPGMVQPILDKNCVRCHGGREGIAGRLDLSGGWTEHFSISYENLISRRETQLTAHLISGIDCMNGTSRWSAKIFPPRSHGSGAAPLAELLVRGHEDRIPDLTRRDRDLLLAWIDTNGLYHGTWDYTDHGCSIKAWGGIKNDLIGEMQAAGCARCHGEGNRVQHFENDWFNLERPELSRILRAPLAKGDDGLGLAWCRDRKVDPKRQRIRILATGGYVHHDLPLEAFAPEKAPPPDESGDPAVTFSSTEDSRYQSMLAVIQVGRRQALATPRADMPGAEIHPGICRQMIPPPIPASLPVLKARVDIESTVHLSWERSARTIGLSAEVHRGTGEDFLPDDRTRIATTRGFAYTDADPPLGEHHYAVILISGTERSAAIRTSITIPSPAPPKAPAGLAAKSSPGRVEIQWREDGERLLRYHVYRSKPGSGEFERLTPEPILTLQYCDASLPEKIPYTYTVRAITRRGAESTAAPPVSAAALPEIKEPIFAAPFTEDTNAKLHGGDAARGKLLGKARTNDTALDLRQGGYVAFDKRPDFDFMPRISVECWVKFTQEGEIPVIVSFGHWNQAGWFLQKLGAIWRWHVGGIDCDGGKPALGRWIHLLGTFDGRTARLYEDGRLVSEKAGSPILTPWTGSLLVGQYSGGPGGQFQVTGWIRGLRIYRRILPLEDAQAAYESTRF